MKSCLRSLLFLCCLLLSSISFGAWGFEPVIDWGFGEVQQDCPNGVCPLPAVRNVVAAPVNVVRNVVNTVAPFEFAANDNCGCVGDNCRCGASQANYVIYSEPVYAYSEPVVTYRTVAAWTPVQNILRERPQILRKVVRRLFRGRCW